MAPVEKLNFRQLLWFRRNSKRGVLQGMQNSRSQPTWPVCRSWSQVVSPLCCAYRKGVTGQSTCVVGPCLGCENCWRARSEMGHRRYYHFRWTWSYGAYQPSFDSCWCDVWIQNLKQLIKGNSSCPQPRLSLPTASLRRESTWSSSISRCFYFLCSLNFSLTWSTTRK